MFGIYTRILSVIKATKDLTLCNYYSFSRPTKTFDFRGEKYSYFIHPYNYTWRNERVVEIPIIWQTVLENRGKDILEIGNVLAHYFDISHDVLDKYEKSTHVINKDIADFNSKKKYDLIVSISTLEHIGWDEDKKDEKKIFRVIRNMKSQLKKNGKIIVTIPLGYNPFIDQYIKGDLLGFSNKFLLRRVSKKNLWQQSLWSLIKNIRYNHPFPYGNGIIVGIIDR